MISFDNEMADTIGLDYDTRAGMLRLSGPLGSPPAERRLATYEYLLGYTMLWPETGGVHMALDEPGGDIMALYTVALADLTGDQLGTALTNFVAMMRAQQLIVTTGIADLDDADAANNADGASPGFDPRMTNSLA